MHVVIVDGDLSYPATSGKRLRTMHLMQRLARRHRITYIARGTGQRQEAQNARAYLGDHGVDAIVVDDPLPRKSGPIFYAKLAANLLSSFPYSVTSHQSAALTDVVRDYAAKHPVDLWQFEWTPYVETVRGLHNPKKLVVAHNVDSLIWQRYYENETQPLKRWYIRQQWRKFERFERRVFAEATRVVAVSLEDAAMVRDRFRMARVDVVDNGIDKAYFQSVRRVGNPRQILFLGSLEWRPNLDAVGLLLERVFPLVRAQEPTARLCIVGRNPPPSLIRRVEPLENVELHANVDDVRPFLAQSGVMTVPLRIGGGSRLKILEALATGLPVVSSQVGAEGLSLRPGKDLVVVEKIEEIASALVACIRNPGKAQAMAEVGRRRVLEHHDWDGLAKKLEQSWEKCIQDKRQQESNLP